MTGIPQPTLTWTREDGRPLSKNTEVLAGGVLRIIGIWGEEAGTYICKAENIVGVAITSASIQIEDSLQDDWRQRPTYTSPRSPDDYRNDPVQTRYRTQSWSTEADDLHNIDRPEVTTPRHKSDNISVITNSGSDVDLNCVSYPHITRPASHSEPGDVVWSRTDGRSIDPRHRVEGGESAAFFSR